MRPAAAAFGVVGLLAAGAAAGWGVAETIPPGSPKQRTSAPSQIVVERERVREAQSVDVAQLTAQMRFLVREELSKLQLASACAPPSKEQPQAEGVDEALEAERDASLKLALNVVDSAIAGGEWTADARQDVRDLWSSLDQERKSQVLSKLFGAFNSGTLLATEQGPPI